MDTTSTNTSSSSNKQNSNDNRTDREYHDDERKMKSSSKRTNDEDDDDDDEVEDNCAADSDDDEEEDDEDDDDDKEDDKEENGKQRKVKQQDDSLLPVESSSVGQDLQQQQADEQPQPEQHHDEPSEPQPQQSFAALGLCSELIQICVNELKWTVPTPIQQQVIPFAIQPPSPRDIVALAQTGSGKTGAFLLPILHNLLTQKRTGSAVSRNGSKVLILTPTRELAVQIYQVCMSFSVGVGVTACCIVGGVDRMAQAIALQKHPHFIIATPGRLVDHLKDTKGFSLQQSLQFLVLDEADRMLSMDFEVELHTILDVIPSSEQRQTMLFSATMTSQVIKLQRVSLNTRNVTRVEVSTKFQTPTTLLQYYLFIPAKYKDVYLTYLMNEAIGKSIIVFSATCSNTQRLAILLRNLNFPAVALHGQLNQNSRLGVLQKFISGSRNIMICTDVASRGLDIPNVDIVINYDLPNHGKEYIHRVGRTARAGKAGQAISFVTQYDVEIYQRIELLLGYKLPSYTEKHSHIQEETVLIFAERVNEAQRLATREIKEQMANGGFGRGGNHHKRRKNNNNNDTEESNIHDYSNMQQKYQKSITGSSNGGRGGSGNKGGALPNQRGSGRQNKKYKHHK